MVIVQLNKLMFQGTKCPVIGKFSIVVEEFEIF